jgi:hypothetical protein
VGSLQELYDRRVTAIPSRWSRFAVQLELVHPPRVTFVAALVAQAGFPVSRTDERSGVVAFDVPGGGLEGLRELLAAIERVEPRAEMSWSVDPAAS